jgi:hypothetical protein
MMRQALPVTCRAKALVHSQVASKEPVLLNLRHGPTNTFRIFLTFTGTSSQETLHGPLTQKIDLKKKTLL